MNFYNTDFAKMLQLVAILYNLPTFILALTGLPLEPFRHIINILAIITLIAIIYLINKFRK